MARIIKTLRQQVSLHYGQGIFAGKKRNGLGALEQMTRAFAVPSEYRGENLAHTS